MNKEITLLDRVEIPIESATREQLKAFAESDLGLTVKTQTPPQFIKKQIASANWDKPFILVDPRTPSARPTAAPLKRPVPGKAEAPKPVHEAVEVAEPMVRMQIAEQAGPGGKRAVYVGVNGRAILIPRNRPVEVKLRYYNALVIAIETLFELNEETNEMESRDVTTYPFQVLKMPSDEVIAEWKAYERKIEKRERAREAA